MGDSNKVKPSYRGKRKGASQRAVTTRKTVEKNISLTVNGKLHELMVGKDVNSDHTLAYTLRETLGYTGTKIACDHGSCGACTVLMTGRQFYPARC